MAVSITQPEPVAYSDTYGDFLKDPVKEQFKKAREFVPPKPKEEPKPKPKPKPKVKVYYGSGVERWRPLVSKYDWKVDKALSIMRCESGGNPNAISRTNDYGLFQLNAPTWIGKYGLTYSNIRNPETNVYAAYRIYKNRNNFSAWVCNRKI